MVTFYYKCLKEKCKIFLIVGKCVEADLGYVGCESNVQYLADRKCSGRRKCQISIPDEDFDNTQPCLTELKFYFEANYTCMKGT